MREPRNRFAQAAWHTICPTLCPSGATASSSRQSTNPPPQHTTHFDHLLGLAILGVLVHHVDVHIGMGIPYLHTFGGLLGVQLFFVLSGYLIADSASRHPLGSCAWHHILRIFLAYWVAYLLAVLQLPSFEFSLLAWTGRVSYAIYLLHFPIIVYGHHKLDHQGALQLIGIGLLVAICAVLMHCWVELPGMAVARPIMRPKPA